MQNKKSNELVAIGNITSPRGVCGEVKVRLYERSVKDAQKIKKYLIGLTENEVTEFEVESVKGISGIAVFKFKEISDRDVAISFIGKYIFVSQDKRIKPKRGNYFIDDLIGCEVVDFLTEKKLGVLLEIEKYPAQDIYNVETQSGVVLLPAIKEIIKN